MSTKEDISPEIKIDEITSLPELKTDESLIYSCDYNDGINSKIIAITDNKLFVRSKDNQLSNLLSNFSESVDEGDNTTIKLKDIVSMSTEKGTFDTGPMHGNIEIKTESGSTRFKKIPNKNMAIISSVIEQYTSLQKSDEQVDYNIFRAIAIMSFGIGNIIMAISIALLGLTFIFVGFMISLTIIGVIFGVPAMIVGVAILGFAGANGVLGVGIGASTTLKSTKIQWELP